MKAKYYWYPVRSEQDGECDCFEQCTEAEAGAFGIYCREPSGLGMHIADCTDKHGAEMVVNRLNGLEAGGPDTWVKSGSIDAETLINLSQLIPVGAVCNVPGELNKSYADFTEMIMALAEAFQLIHAGGSDYWMNHGDYWGAVDDFAEKVMKLGLDSLEGCSPAKIAFKVQG